MVREILMGVDVLLESHIPIHQAREFIVLAIENMKVLRVYYSGKYREIEPHCLGINHKGTIVLRAYQRYGGSLSGISPGWKLFNISKFEKVSILSGEGFKVRPLYHKEDAHMVRYIARLDRTDPSWRGHKKAKAKAVARKNRKAIERINKESAGVGS